MIKKSMLIVLLIGVSGLTQAHDRVFLGFTGAAFTGDAGFPKMNNACRNRFGGRASICTTMEASRSAPVHINSPYEYAWLDHVNDPGTASTLYSSFRSTTCSSFTSTGSSPLALVKRESGEVVLNEDNSGAPIGRLYFDGNDITCSSSLPVACCDY